MQKDRKTMAEGDPKIGQNDSWRGDLISISTTEDPMPTLYHTDTSYYSQIVRLVLEEEGIQYKSRHFDIHSSMEQLNSWYLNINPNGVVPTLIYQGKPIVESRDISLFVVEEISNEGRLLLKQTKVRRILQIFFKSTSYFTKKKSWANCNSHVSRFHEFTNFQIFWFTKIYSIVI